MRAVNGSRLLTTSCHVIEIPNSDRESCIAQAHILREVYDGAGLYVQQAYDEALSEN